MIDKEIIIPEEVLKQWEDEISASYILPESQFHPRWQTIKEIQDALLIDRKNRYLQDQKQMREMASEAWDNALLKKQELENIHDLAIRTIDREMVKAKAAYLNTLFPHQSNTER